ncbi:PERIANTHIA family protein [Populus alba x Populus x berolinensis]|uniref:PERIANTHIA family protein n=1 Tax=Populus alba x Populus x berolinensis TaxID=444605 RepID=A0AAD6Q7Y2_9ROSI|nr:PERIANTHIA family protein [Populus alba x Populus x berolinensis]
MYQKGTGFDSSLGNGQSNENWGDSGMADNSLQTDTSTDVSSVYSLQTLRRLAQNREAARRGRLRKKAYVQQLENSRLRLTQLEQELQRARQQGFFYCIWILWGSWPFNGWKWRYIVT